MLAVHASCDCRLSSASRQSRLTAVCDERHLVPSRRRRVLSVREVTFSKKSGHVSGGASSGTASNWVDGVGKRGGLAQAQLIRRHAPHPNPTTIATYSSIDATCSGKSNIE